MSGEYPQCAEWAARSEQRDVITNFLEWLTGQEIELCSLSARDRYEPIFETTDGLLYDYFGIDRKELDRERRAILDEARGSHE